LQMQRNLAGLRHAAGVPDEADFLPLLDAAAPLLAALPAGSTQALHYETGRLDVDIRLGSKADILQLQQRLQRKGLKVNAGDMHDAGNGVDTRLSLQAGDGS
jgi:general secretion pathway protein L